MKAIRSLPDEILLFKEFPYPLYVSDNLKFLPLFSNNPRLVSNMQIELRNKLNNIDFLRNAFIFSLKDIFVFKNIRNPRPHEFDFFPDKDYEGEAKRWNALLKKDSKFSLVTENEKFSLFTYKSKSPYDFFIYNPAKVIISKTTSIVSRINLNIEERPVILNIPSPDLVSFFKDLDANVKIEIKLPLHNPTKYYIKIRDINNPFLLHFNQTFSPSWKLFFIDKKDYDAIKPITNWKRFPLTNNKKCLYRDSLLGFENFKIALTKVALPGQFHFRGNFLGNTFLITHQNVPPQYKDAKELYLVLLYKPQIYYTFALLNAAFSLIVLGVAAFFQQIKNKQL